MIWEAVVVLHKSRSHTERHTAQQYCMLVQIYPLFAIHTDTDSCCCASRKLPGYPKIDTHNDYFLARFDGALIDGQSWGQGRPTLDPTTQHVDAQYRNTHHAMLAKLHQKEVWIPRCFVAVSFVWQVLLKFIPEDALMCSA